MAYTRKEVEQMYRIWHEADTDKSLKDYFDLTTEEMKQINKLTYEESYE